MGRLSLLESVLLGVAGMAVLLWAVVLVWQAS